MMTTPSIDLSASIAPAILDFTQGSGVATSATPESVAAFQCAMAKPLAENATLDEAFAAAVAATATIDSAIVAMPCLKDSKVVRPAGLALDSEQTVIEQPTVAEKPTVPDRPLVIVSRQPIVVDRAIVSERPTVPDPPGGVVDKTQSLVASEVLAETAPDRVHVAVERIPISPQATIQPMNASAPLRENVAVQTVDAMENVAQIPQATETVHAEGLVFIDGQPVVEKAIVAEKQILPDQPILVEKPIVSDQPILIEKPAVVAEKPAAIAEKSGTVDEKPTTIFSQPIVAERQSPIAVDQTQSLAALEISDETVSAPRQVGVKQTPTTPQVPFQVPSRTPDASTTLRENVMREAVVVSEDADSAVAPTATPVVNPAVTPVSDPVVAVNDAPAITVTPADVVRTQTATATEAVASPSAVFVHAAQAVADVLLVSPGLLRGQGEIVVQLRPDVLEGTEVRIAVTGRQLNVQFCPTTVDMAVLLEGSRMQIASHLTAKIATFNVSVDVRKKRV